MEANSPELSSSDKVFNFDGAQSSFFPSVGLKLTGACRMRCPFCCEPNRAQALAPIDIFVAIADKLRQWGTRRLCLTGGEPLLYPKIDSFLKHTKSLGFYNLLLTSDGALFKDNHNQILPFVDAVRFSVHAVGSQLDELVGYIGSFLNTEKAVALLAKR